MSAISLVFFGLFGIIIFGMYVGIRRQWARTSVLAAGGVFGSVMSMMMFSLGQGNVFLQALFVGLLVGGAFSVGALAIALYFQGQALRQESVD